MERFIYRGGKSASAVTLRQPCGRQLLHRRGRARAPAGVDFALGACQGRLPNICFRVGADILVYNGTCSRALSHASTPSRWS
jgi:hypothetical protein